MRAQSVDARGRGPASGEKAGAGGVAEGGLAVGVGKEGAALGEPVHVRGERLGMPAEATDPVVQIVDGDEQDVWGGGLRLGSKGRQRAQGEHNGGKEVLHRDPVSNPVGQPKVARNLARLLDGHALGEVPRFVHVAAALDGGVISEELERDGGEDR